MDLFCVFVFRLQKRRFERLEVHQTCIYSNKINMLMPKVNKTCIYSNKSKVLIVKSHQTCIYSKKQKNKNIKNQFIYASQFHIESEIFAFCFLSICRFGDFSLSKLLFFWVHAGFAHFWHQNVDLLEYMQVLCTLVKNHAFFASHAGFGEVKVTKPANGMQFWSEQSSD